MITERGRLSVPVNWLQSFFSGIMCLILVLRCNLLRYTIEFIVVLLLLNLFLGFLIHVISPQGQYPQFKINYTGSAAPFKMTGNGI